MLLLHLWPITHHVGLVLRLYHLGEQLSYLHLVWLIACTKKDSQHLLSWSQSFWKRIVVGVLTPLWLPDYQMRKTNIIML
jgi:hypothetical protein